MTDSPPLLPGLPAFGNIEDVIRHVDKRGHWQYWTTIKAAIVTLGMALIGYAQSLYFVGKMDHECVLYDNDAGLTKRDLNSTFTDVDATITADAIAAKTAAACSIPSSNFDNITASKAACMQWQYSSPYFDSTMVSEYDMVCDRAYLLPTFQAAVVAGQIIGNACSGLVSDRYGRRWAVQFGFFGTLASALTMAFVQPLWMHIALRTCVGIFTTAAWNGLFVICMELAVPERRKSIGVYVGITWAFGAALASLLAVFIRNWRQLALVTTVVGAVVASPFALAIPESPRWLVLQRRFARARRLFAGSTADKDSLPPGDMFLESIYRRHVEEQQQQGGQVSPVRHVIQLLSERKLRVRSFMLTVDWIVVAFVYFGILYYGSGALPGSPMLLVGIMSIGRAAANPLYIILFKFIGCRNSLMGALAIICVTMLFLGLVPLQHHSVTAVVYAVLYVLAYVASDCCFAAIYIVTGELYPTVLRQTSLGFFSLVARAGAFGSPYVAALFSHIWLPLPAVIFSCACAVATVAALALPRTDNAALPETVADAKQLDDELVVSMESPGKSSLTSSRHLRHTAALQVIKAKI